MSRVSDNTFEDYPSEMKFVLKLTENVWQKECREKSSEDLDVANILRELKETKTKLGTIIFLFIVHYGLCKKWMWCVLVGLKV